MDNNANRLTALKDGIGYEREKSSYCKTNMEKEG